MRFAHRHQTDKLGNDYFTHHLQPVAELVPPHLYYVALAHDLLEDTPTETSTMEDEGFTDFEIRMVKLLTSSRDESRQDYLQRVRTDMNAVKVKIADVVNNLSKIEMAGPNGKTLNEALKSNLRGKYFETLQVLSQHSDSKTMWRDKEVIRLREKSNRLIEAFVYVDDYRKHVDGEIKAFEAAFYHEIGLREGDLIKEG